MTLIALIAFWSSLALIVHTLAGFPLFLWLRAKLLARPIDRGECAPKFSVIIACYNEERHIRGRIENLLGCDYPSEKLEIIVASDGSTDRTDAIVGEFHSRGARLVRVARGGKGQALNAAIATARGEVLVFTDANTEFGPDALRVLGSYFHDPEVGGVAGNQVYLRDGERSLSADGECLHWNLDTWQKQLQSAGGNVTSATGAIYAIRTECFDPVPLHVMDDYYISTGVITRGMRLVFATDARAYEPVATRDGIEFRRKVRVATQGLRAVWARRELLNPLSYGWYSIQAFTHKVLRRLLVFPLMIMVLAACALVAVHPFYLFVVAGAAMLGLLACLGFLLRNSPWGRGKVFTIPHFFLMTQAAMILAAFRAFFGQGLRHWEPERHGIAPAGSTVASSTVASSTGVSHTGASDTVASNSIATDAMALAAGASPLSSEREVAGLGDGSDSRDESRLEQCGT